MGNASSQPDRSAAPRPSRTRSMLRPAARRRPAGPEHDHEHDPHSSQQAQDQTNSNASHPTNPTQTSTSRLARLTHSHIRSPPRQESQEQARHDLLHRARGSFRVLMNRSGSVRRRAQPSTDPTSRAHAMLSSLAEQSRAGSSRERGNQYAPRLPSIDTSGFGADQISFSDEFEPSPPPQSAHSQRRSNLRFNPLRQLARRRSPQAHDALRRTAAEHPGEDQAAMLSRLLSVAAAATAATLMGDDAQAYGEAGTLSGGAGMGDLSSNGEDGSFDGFLRALQNGRIASALREGADNNNSSREGPLNFFRMFRFGSSTAGPEARASPHQDDDRQDGEATEGRMVPIIIVGIRSISPNSGSESASPSEELPPFMDPLGNFSNPLPTNALGQHGHESIDSMLSPPRNGTSFRHRRRASMGGFGMSRNRLGERHEEQRDQTSPDRRRERPWSMASSSSHLEPRPPPATPASPSPELSRIPSASSTPGHSRPPSFIANSMRESPGVSRRNSILPRPTAALTAHTEETVAGSTSESSENLLGSQRDSNTFNLNPHRRSDTIPHVHYPRFASGHPRRNGVVEPDHLPPLSRASTSHGTESTATNGEQRSNGDSRSWIIYVLGGSYPENHPILTTPSLFTENPTYEDMMLLSALLGPAKAPVASDEEVEAAGGLYSIVLSDASACADVEKTRQLVAVATDSEERVELEVGQRCLVCLCDFEANESGRKLVKCNHLFHKDCIDQWLTQGRNSCPLCRGQGVDQKSSTGTSSPSEEASPPEWTPESPAVVEAEASG